MLKKIASSPSIIVLVYHRVDITDTNPWNICIAPKIFEEQIQFLKDNYCIINIEEAVRQARTNDIIAESVCITFDDGYADNYLNALPVLQKYNCPATFFIATAFIDTKAFWWDELEIALLHSKKLPGIITLEINGNKLEFIHDTIELTEEQWQQHIKWRWYEAPTTDRCSLFLNIWEKLRALGLDEIKKNIASIKELAGSNMKLLRPPLNKQQLKMMFKHSLCNIALHTHGHSDLSTLEKNPQVEAILSCKHILKSGYDIDSNYLAYPYGRFDNNTIAAVKELGLAGCFTTNAINIEAGSSPYKLGRYQVSNWNSITFKNKLQSWKDKRDLNKIL